MKKFLIILLIAVLAPVSARDIVSVDFKTTPGNVLVESLNERLEWDTLGHADKPIQVNVEKYTLFRFSAEGYKPREESISQKAFNTRDEGPAVWPRSGTFELEPLPSTRLKHNLFRYGWLILVPFPVLAYFLKLRREGRENQERVAYLEKLQEEAQMSKDTVLGQRLGKYLLTRFLGKGGMAAVYRGSPGINPKSGEQVAVKVLSAADDEQSVARFKREVKICQKLIHPNIVALYDWGREGDLIFLAMELMDGGSLEDRIKEGVGYEEALDLFDQVLAGMEFAHSQGVTHRDLKPDNILLNKQGKPKVTDFGLAKLQSIRTVTVTGSVMGTPAYMSPEQIQGEDPSPSMDQYALGVLGYQLFTGSLPFKSEEMMVVITAHLVEEPPDPRTFKEDLPKEMAEILLRMLHKEPEERFRDLSEVRMALRALRS